MDRSDFDSLHLLGEQVIGGGMVSMTSDPGLAPTAEEEEQGNNFIINAVHY